MPEIVKFVLASCEAEAELGRAIHTSLLTVGKAGNLFSSCIKKPMIYFTLIALILRPVLLKIYMPESERLI